MSEGGFNKGGRGPGKSHAQDSFGYGRAPGRVTRSSRLPPRKAAVAGSAPAPVQTTPDPATDRERNEQDALTARWLDTVFRPDLYPPPVQRQSAGDGTAQSHEDQALARADRAGEATPRPRSRALLVDEGPLLPGQMHTAAFLAALERALSVAALESLGPFRAAEGAHLLARGMWSWKRQSAAAVERAMARIAAGATRALAAEEIIPLVAARVREGFVTWRDTGVLPRWLLGLAPDQAAGPAATPAAAGPQPGVTTAGGSDAALAAELGLTLTTAPPIGAGERALVGMQVTFQLDLLRPPRDQAVTITAWELATPRGRFAARPTGPTTTLPITAPGPHVFRAQIRLSDGRHLAIERRFEAETAATRARAALAAVDAVSFEQHKSQLELSRALLGPSGPAEQGQGATRRIVTSAPNPARAGAARPAQLSFAVQEHQRAGDSAPETRHRWYVRPLRWDDMPAALGGHSRAKTPQGLDAYELGTGPAARFPATHKNLYVVLCQAEDAQGRPLGDARYLQSVVGQSEEEALGELDRHIGRMDDLGARLQGPRVPVTAVHVATRSGHATPLRLYLGRAKADPKQLLLVDLTPGLDAERSKLVYQGASASALLDAFAGDNKYAEGVLSLRIGENELGIEPVARQLATDGESMLEHLSSLSGIASLALGLGAIVAAPFTGGGSLVVLTLVVGAAGAGVAAGALSLADRLQNEQLEPVGVALDVLTIATSFLNAGLAVKALRSGPAMLVASRGGRYLLWSNVAAEGLSGILVTVEAADQIIAVAQSDLAHDQKLGALVRVVSNLILTGALLGVSYGEMRTVRSRLDGPLGEVHSELSDASRMAHKTEAHKTGAAKGEIGQTATPKSEIPNKSTTSDNTKQHVHEGETEKDPQSPYHGKWNGKGIHSWGGLKARVAKDGYKILGVTEDPTSGIRRVTVQRIGKDPRTGAETKGTIKKTIYPKRMSPAEINTAGEAALAKAEAGEPGTKFDPYGTATKSDRTPADGYFEADVDTPAGKIRVQGWFKETTSGKQISSHTPRFEKAWPTVKSENY